MEERAPGFVMAGGGRQVWVRAEDRGEWEKRGYHLVTDRQNAPTGAPAEAAPPPPPASAESPTEAEPADLAAMKVSQLRERAAEAGIEGASRMNKAALIEAIEGAAGAAEPEAEAEPAQEEPAGQISENSWPTRPSRG